jgi:hypothetical protein
MVVRVRKKLEQKIEVDEGINHIDIWGKSIAGNGNPIAKYACVFQEYQWSQEDCGKSKLAEIW